MNVISKLGLLMAIVASTVAVSSSPCKAHDGYVYNYADMEGWGVQYYLDARLTVQAVRVINFAGDRYKPNPDDDDPTGPIGPWVKVTDVQRVYGGFSKFVGFKPNPEDDDDPWGPLGPVVRGMDRQFKVMGAYNAAFMPDPTGDDDICPWPFPWPCPWWELTDIWEIKVVTELGTLGHAAVFEASAMDVFNQMEPEPTPWKGFESLADGIAGGR